MISFLCASYVIDIMAAAENHKISKSKVYVLFWDSQRNKIALKQTCPWNKFKTNKE